MIELLFFLGCIPPQETHVLITEVMTNNQGSLQDQFEEPSDWIEITNLGNAAVNLHSWSVADTRTKTPWFLPQIVLEPSQSIIVYASGRNLPDIKTPLHTDFRLRKTGDQLLLFNEQMKLMDSVNIPALPIDISWGRDSTDTNVFGYLLQSSPGIFLEQKTHSTLVDQSALILSEVQFKNNTTVLDPRGVTPDWIEVQNISDEKIDLSTYYLSDNLQKMEKWRFPPIIVEPHEFFVVYATSEGKNTPEYFPYNLSDQDTLVLSNTSHTQIEVLSLSNFSTGLVGKIEGSWMENIIPTPYRENRQLQESDIYISEIFPFKTDKKEEWIELFNPTDREINLAEYQIAMQKQRVSLPNTILPPNGFYVYTLDRSNTDSNPTLSSSGSLIQLIKKDIIVETIRYPKIPPNYSYGKDMQGMLVYFPTPTPNVTNATKYKTRWLSSPQLTKESGYYQESFDLRLQQPQMDTIYRYALNGDEPNENSPVFPASLTIDKNTVLRVQAFANDAIESDILSVSYIFDTNTTLPSIHLYFENRALFHPVDGIFVKGLHAQEAAPHLGANYWKKREVPMQFSYWDSKGILQFQGMGKMRVHGGYSRMLKHKNLQLNARSDSGMASFSYPFFPQRAEQEYSKLVLRGGGQAQLQFLFTDIFMFDMLQTTHLYGLAYQTVHIYFNEKYWGIYNIREKLDENYISRIANVSPEDVKIVSIGIDERNTEFSTLLRQLSLHDPADPESYKWISSVVDMDSYIDMLMYHIFFANSDYGNTKMWKSPNHSWHFLVFDADLILKGEFSPDRLFFSGDFRFAQLRILNKWLLRSPEFTEAMINRATMLYQNDFSPVRFHLLLDNYRERFTTSMAELERQKKYGHNWVEEANKFEQAYLRNYTKIPSIFQKLLGLTDTEIQRYFPNET